MKPQTVNQKIEIATGCYLRGEPMSENCGFWGVYCPRAGDVPQGGIIYQGNDIIKEIAALLFGGSVNRPRITPRVYRSALRLFKIIHINTAPAYRIRALQDEGGAIRFTRGKQKKGV